MGGQRATSNTCTASARVRETDNVGEGGRETRIRRIRVEWKLKKIDDNREEKRVDKFMDMGVFVEDFWKTTS